jgi:S-adenosyl methyltransferase
MGPLDELRSATGFDPTIPNVARIYDYLLGGKDHFPADRQLADEIIRLIPGAALSCRLNRLFLGRVVTHLAKSGISQFIDIGSGLPTAMNVHEVAKDVNPDARVVYVDNDPMVTVHARALLADEGVIAIDGDLRHPEGIIDGSRSLIDFRRPVAVLLLAVVHFLTDDEGPYELAGAFKEVMAPNSCLALSHATDDQMNADVSKEAQQVYSRASAPVIPRSRDEITRLFSGLTLIGPGLVDINTWPDLASCDIENTYKTTLMYGGVGIKLWTMTAPSMRLNVAGAAAIAFADARGPQSVASLPDAPARHDIARRQWLVLRHAARKLRDLMPYQEPPAR